MSGKKATARAGSNIAFIKYWGVSDPTLNLPLNASLSMTLADAFTTTTVEFDDARARDEDEITLDGERLSTDRASRISNHLDRLRAEANVSHGARVVSHNNFPMAAGIASSASGFAALTVAAAAALGLRRSPEQLSSLARLASGSACRSLFGGFVGWDAGTTHENSHARSLFPAEHWDLRDVVAVVSSAEKKISSASGHTLALTSPLVDGRTAHVADWLDQVTRALENRDLLLLGRAIELDALAMHGIMMTSTPSLLYWQPGTLTILHAVQEWRAEGLPVYFTIDAGPNVHLICEPQTADTIANRLRALACVEEVITSGPGGPPSLLNDHLF